MCASVSDVHEGGVCQAECLGVLSIFLRFVFVFVLVSFRFFDLLCFLELLIFPFLLGIAVFESYLYPSKDAGPVLVRTRVISLRQCLGPRPFPDILPSAFF